MKHRTKIICIFLLFLFNSVNASDYYTVMKTNTLDIRSGPGENYPIVGTLSLGDTVLIDKIVTPWCQIIENNKTKGYANGWYLTKVETSVNSNKSSNNFLIFVVIAVVLIIIIVVAISSSKKKVQPPIATDNSTNTNDSKNQVKDRPRVIVTKSTKSVGLAIFLSIIFPYFGVLYSTVSGFFWLFFSYIGMWALLLYTGFKTLNDGVLFLGFVLSMIHWLISIIWAGVAASNYNKRIMSSY